MVTDRGDTPVDVMVIVAVDRRASAWASASGVGVGVGELGESSPPPQDDGGDGDEPVQRTGAPGVSASEKFPRNIETKVPVVVREPAACQLAHGRAEAV